MIESDNSSEDISLLKSSNYVLLNKRSRVIRIERLLKEEFLKEGDFENPFDVTFNQVGSEFVSKDASSDVTFSELKVGFEFV